MYMVYVYKVNCVLYAHDMCEMCAQFLYVVFNLCICVCSMHGVCRVRRVCLDFVNYVWCVVCLYVVWAAYVLCAQCVEWALRVYEVYTVRVWCIV